MSNITPSRPFTYNTTTSSIDELPSRVAPPATSQLVRYASGTPRAMVVGHTLDDLAIFKAAYGDSRAVQGGESHFRAWLAQQDVRPGDVIALPSGIDGFVGKVHDADLLDAAIVETSAKLGRELGAATNVSLLLRALQPRTRAAAVTLRRAR